MATFRKRNKTKRVTDADQTKFRSLSVTALDRLIERTITNERDRLH